MEQIYKIDWCPDSHRVTLGHRGVVVCSWSCSNLFAFTVEKQVNGFAKQFLNVINPNQPWDVFSAPYKGGEITCLQWDYTGTRFLTGDSHGLCCLWHMPNNVTNVWSAKSRQSVDLEGEEILAVGWLHSGSWVLFHIEKLENPSASEKFERIKFRPSVVEFGGKHMDGYIMVTGTGLVSVRLLKSENETIAAQVRLNVPCHQQLADIAFTSRGKIVILTTDGDIRHLIQFHEIQLNYDSDDESLKLEVKAMPSLPLQAASEENCPFTHISHAKFYSRENQEKIQVLICLSGPSTSSLQSWLIQKDNTKLHRVFVQTPSPSVSAPEEVKYWKFVTKSETIPRVANFSVPSLPTDTSSSENKVSQETKFFSGLCIAVACSNNTILILHRIFLTPYVIQHLPETTSVHDTGVGKRAKTVQNSCVQNAIFSAMSCALIAVDNCGSVLLYRVPPWLNKARNANSDQALKQIVQLLLYCLMTGRDWWDILLHIQADMVDKVIMHLTAEIKQQSDPLQQILQSRALAMKITIYHISSSSIATDCHLKLLFDALSLVFRSLLRPHQQVTGEESDPAAHIKHISCTSTETNIDKLVHNVDTDSQTLQSMQQLIQWVADVTLYFLASAPSTLLLKQLNKPGETLYRDKEWLSVLREMLVLIRVWGLLKSACSPVFTVLDPKLDVLAHSFKLVTSLWHSSGDSSNVDQSLVNDCSMLPGQVIIPSFHIISAPNGVISHMKTYQGVAKLVFGQCQPDIFLRSDRQHQMDYVNIPGSAGKVDALRRIYLGKMPNQDMKECTRCGMTTMYNNLQRPTLKVWDQRFIKSCLCGGRWRKMSSTSASHV